MKIKKRKERKAHLREQRLPLPQSNFCSLKKKFLYCHSSTMDAVREKGLQDYRKKLLEHAEVEGRLKESKLTFVLMSIL